MAKQSESAWAKSMPAKEQLHVVKRLFVYTKPYLNYFIPAILLQWHYRLLI